MARQDYPGYERLRRSLWRACKPFLRRSRMRDRKTREVVFVAAQQRSGSNMLMDVLDLHTCTDVFHETDSRAFDNYVMKPIETIDALVARSSAPVVVLKSLCELQRLGDLLDHFPGSRAVWLVRDYADVVNSMVNQFTSTGEVLKAMRANPANGGWRGERMSVDTHAKLCALVGDHASETESAAFHWYMRNVLYFEQGLDSDDRVTLVFYEDLVTAPMGLLEKLLPRIGLDLERRMLRHVKTSSIQRRPRPQVGDALSTLCEELERRLREVRLSA